MIPVPHRKLIKYFNQKLIKWGKQHYRDYPWRTSQNKYHSLVAEIMLQRTKAEQVSPIYSEFVRVHNGPEDFMKDPNDQLFKSLGLPERYNQFLRLNELILKNGIPLNKTELMAMPGIGEYISSAFLSLHCNIRAYLIDSNIIRTYGRFWGFPYNAETRRKKWFIKLCNELTPARNHRSYNYFF